MKKLLIIVPMIISQWAFSQELTNDYIRMIDSAILIQKKMQTNDSVVRDLYLINEKDEPYTFLRHGDRKLFKEISVYSKKNKNILSKGIDVWKVIPDLKGNCLRIKIVDLRISYKNGNYNYVNKGGGCVIFEYSCDEKKWLVIDSSWSGI